jgi:hypothetical protein
MQIIALINQKGRGGKTAQERLINNLNNFSKEKIIFIEVN